MDIKQVYNDYLILGNFDLNNLNTGAEVTTFVTGFNHAQRLYAEQHIQQYRNSLVRGIEEIIEVVSFDGGACEGGRLKYPLPLDYMELIDIVASIAGCAKVKTLEIKPGDVAAVESNTYTKASTTHITYTITRDTIHVYTGGNVVGSLTLEYFKQPPDVDIAGYIHVDNTPSQDIDPIWRANDITKILNSITHSN